MHSLFLLVLLLSLNSLILPNWGNIIESDINRSLAAEYEIDLDKDGCKESDSSEKESNLIKHFDLCEIFYTISNLLPNEITFSISPAHHAFSYSFLFIRRIERPPNFKLS